MIRRVGLNLLYLVPGHVGGTETYARELVGALARAHPDVRFVAWTGREAAPVLRATGGWPETVEVRALHVPARLKPARIAIELAELPLAAARARLDVLHSLGTTSPLLVPCPSVVTVHDLIYLHFPGAFPAAARLGLRALVGPGARRADRVLTDSHHGREEVVRHLGVPAGRVDVAPLGVGMSAPAAPTPARDLRARLTLGERPVVFAVAAALPHKNLDRLLEAMVHVPDAALVLTGHAGLRLPTLQALAARLGLAERVRFTGWVSREDVEGLYALASCFAYPTLHEGFGLPVLEAMRRGVPVACSGVASLPEVAGDAAEFFDPLDPLAIAAALRRLLSDERRRAELVARGHAQAARFSWERCAEDTWASYERAVARPGR